MTIDNSEAELSKIITQLYTEQHHTNLVSMYKKAYITWIQSVENYNQILEEVLKKDMETTKKQLQSD